MTKAWHKKFIYKEDKIRYNKKMNVLDDSGKDPIYKILGNLSKDPI